VLVDMLTDEPAEVRDVWHWQWDQLMACVESLSRQHREGRMTVVQEREFAELSRLLQSNRKLVEALGCQIPPEISLSAETGA